ncbi:hypothetical protein LTR37_003284 [Vermiconidia calcicola]|uniref:Uncharacterized protein n=1 Tax=Vermiconidia calcicola TaxID=1690605 RepID=A0ACC3NQA9_9PEZI|nr:hypothetical protein LTR37_003284 [Vermiconidia calcicola]
MDDDITACLQSVPQELYDKIYNDVVTRTTLTIHIDESYKPPSAMQVDRQSRSLFTERYYSKYIARVRSDIVKGSDMDAVEFERQFAAGFPLDQSVQHPRGVAVKFRGFRVEVEVEDEADIEDDFVNRVQGLPPELYNHIYHDVFTPATPTIRIDESYEPPLLMQVDGQSRALFMERYYSKHAIIVADTIDWGLVLDWLKSLSPLHLARLCGARYIVTADMVVQRSEMEAFKDAYATGYAKGFAAQLRTMRGVEIDWTSLRIEIEVESEE